MRAERASGWPVLLVYDDNDRFDPRGSPTSMAAFEAELATAQMRRQRVEQAPDVGGAELRIRRYRRPGLGHVERRSTTEK